jgi:beta-glucosidase
VTRLHAATVALVAGATPVLLAEFISPAEAHPVFQEARLRLGWLPPSGVLSPSIHAAAELARQSDVAVVVARTYEGEEMDRPDIALPNGQDELIRAVAAANPRTVVVLMSGGPVETASWEGAAPAVLEAWYAGQEQGAAMARVLFGEVNPSGKLPLTFPRSLTETPVATPEQYPGVNGAVHYSERLRVGYRGYDALGLVPQYPFGHGLSYTTFAYDSLRIDVGGRARESSALPEKTFHDLTGLPEAVPATLQIHFHVTNTGERAGAEVAQVYLGMPDGLGEPPRRLVGWARVELAPGERREVTVPLDAQSPEGPLGLWDAEKGGWSLAGGAYTVHVGASSRDLRLSGTVNAT